MSRRASASRRHCASASWSSARSRRTFQSWCGSPTGPGPRTGSTTAGSTTPARSSPMSRAGAGSVLSTPSMCSASPRPSDGPSRTKSRGRTHFRFVVEKASIAGSCAGPVRDESGQVIRWFSTATDVTDQRFLSNATKLLASSLDMRATLEQLANLAVPELADWCAVDVLNDGHIDAVAIAHWDPAKLAAVRDWSQRYPSDLQASGGIGEVIRTGRAMLFPELSDAQLVRVARDAEHLRQMRDLGMASVIIARSEERRVG